MMKRIPALRTYGDNLTEAMVDFYTQSQQHFTADMQPHYIYSPRELTRWKVALNQGLDSVKEVEDLVRLYVHEGLRLFEDRLVYEHEKEWCNRAIDACANRWFGNCNLEKALERPIYFTTYMSQEYKSVDAGELKEFIEARLKQFYEEVLDVPLVVFDSVLDHILRIDRVLKQ
jgi:dynein heavy chain 1